MCKKFQNFTMSGRQLEVCYSFQHHACRRGKNCKFAHLYWKRTAASEKWNQEKNFIEYDPCHCLPWMVPDGDGDFLDMSVPCDHPRCPNQWS
jgi:hypothetical protein